MRLDHRRSRHSFARPLVSVTALAALVAGCDATGGNEPVPRAERAGALPKPSPTRLWDRSPSSVAAVGDSITRGFDACGVLTDCPAVSWATGTDAGVRSLAHRLLGPGGTATRSWNHARSGAHVADLPRQVGLAAAKRPDLLTVMVGANDACSDEVTGMTPVADFRASFESAMKRLRAASPKTFVYVASVPDLKRLWSEGSGNPVGRQVWKLGICSSMLADPESVAASDVERRQTVRDRVVAYNEVLEEVCAEDLRCRYDGGAVFEYEFGQKQLSPWDWFHPSRDGQERLAEIAYRNVTAEKAPS
ncbi:GDSL-type esterase/lipase family protein [Streptomyces sp. GC420]|uniref:GDSL-type esterase/lipase family protein n=1 Tax=Streptomyces sp. GC420 TaxID=2697568 RepID=UPI0014150CAF|nr:GDSL-type esterase/lipase family protein [Streptomyces sp. GC420]NBM15576.1 SGNH/GDSL hydrolase family protein [Streptomyces sp. GC420]